MRVLVTGSRGFIGKNLAWRIRELAGFDFGLRDIPQQQSIRRSECRYPALGRNPHCRGRAIQIGSLDIEMSQGQSIQLVMAGLIDHAARAAAIAPRHLEPRQCKPRRSKIGIRPCRLFQILLGRVRSAFERGGEEAGSVFVGREPGPGLGR